MESAFLLEKKLISMTFNSIKETAYLLVSDGEKLDLTEENISSDVIIKRFKLLKQNDLSITSNNYKKLPKDTFEGYSIYYWELMRKLFLSYPSGYILIYDCNSGSLDYHFQARGKNPYIVRNIEGSPIQKSFFFSAESMRNVYHCSFESVIKGNPQYTKLVLPKNVTVNDILCHPNERFIFIACSDGLVRVFDYSTNKEILTGLVDLPLDTNGKPFKNQADIIKQNNIMGVCTLDINNYGNYLLSGCENGFLYLWDALAAIKDKRVLLAKSRFSSTGLLCSKFLKMKQFENLDRIICLTKEGKIYICNIIIKSKHYSFNKLYENSVFKQIPYSLVKYNIITSVFISCSLISNLISIRWPNLRMDKIKNYDGKFEEYLLFLNYTTKFFFIYDNIHPKINFPHCSQLGYPYYTDLIPSLDSKSQLNFENYIYVCDSFFLYQYSVSTGNTKKLLNYTKEFKVKTVLPLKFEVRPKRKKILPSSPLNFIIQVQNDNQSKSVLFIQLNGSEAGNTVSFTQKFDDIIDFTALGREEDDLEYILFLHKNKQIAIVFDIKNKTSLNKSIEGSILRMYWTPFSGGYSVIYRNVLNHLKFSENIRLSVFHKSSFDQEFSGGLIRGGDNDNARDQGISENFDINNNSSNIYTNIRPSEVNFYKKENNQETNFESNVKDNNSNSNSQYPRLSNQLSSFPSFDKTESTKLTLFSFRNDNKTNLQLDFSEREIEINWMSFKNFSSTNKNDNLKNFNSKNMYTNIDNSNNNHNENNSSNYEFWCSISMIEKILICDHELTPIYQLKITLLDNPNIISSMFWIGKTLIYTRGNDLYYFYPPENIHSKIFTNDQTHTAVAGVLADRFFLTDKIWGSNELINVSVTSPAISPLEPILIGYLDSNIEELDYNVIKDSVINLFSNQVSDTLINKFIQKNLNEVARMFVNDQKSSYLDIRKKLSLSNSLLHFDDCLDLFFPKVEFKNKIHVEDLIWKLEYEQNYDELKKSILEQHNVLLSYGFFDNALQLLELISDYPRAINLILLVGKNSDFVESLKLFAEKAKLSYSELILMINSFILDHSQLENKNKIIDLCQFNTTNEVNSKEFLEFNQKTTSNIKNNNDNILQQNFNNNNMNKSQFNNDLNKIAYNKVFDNYKGEPFLFDFLDVEKSNKNNNPSSNLVSNSNSEYIGGLKKNNSHITNVSKKILSFGETPFSQFVQVYNNESQRFENVEIFNLQLQKVEHFYGYNNIIDEKRNQNKQQNLDYDNFIPLSQIDQNQDQSNNNEDPSISQDLDEINEKIYLSFYLRCDKGNGLIVEDITNNQNEGKIILSNVPSNLIKSVPLENNSNNNFTNNASQINSNQGTEYEDGVMWSPPLEEFEPLELDDKWGRKSPQSHSIIFKENYSTSLKIKNNSCFKFFHQHFTVEFWMRPYSLCCILFKKESLVVKINNGEFLIEYGGKSIELKKIDKGADGNVVDRNIYCDKWQHIAISYRKSNSTLKIYIMGELINEATLLLTEGISNFGDILFGDGNLNAQITEIRGWSQSIPQRIIKENMKCPLAILSENKRKLNKMKITKNDGGGAKKGQGFKSFHFGSQMVKSTIGTVPASHHKYSVVQPKNNQIIEENTENNEINKKNNFDMTYKNQTKKIGANEFGEDNFDF